MAEILSGWQGIAATAIIISIILAGIALGLGRAFSMKKLERFGADELFQSAVNAAILGFAVALSTLVLQVGGEFTPHSQALSCPPGLNPADQAVCAINATTQLSFQLSQDIVRAQNTLAYYQTLSLNFGNFSIQPLANLDGVSNQLSNSLYALQFSIFASSLNAQLLTFVSSSWFGVMFAAGLVLRSFFLSRKFGAFLIACAISLIIFYPLMVLLFPLPVKDLNDARGAFSSFLTNTNYQTVPIVDLNNNNAVAVRIYNMSFSGGADFTGDATVIVQSATKASASALFYGLIAPLLAFISTVVLVTELSRSFAGEIANGISQL